MEKKNHPADPSQPIESWERNSHCLKKKKPSAKPVLVGVWILKSLLIIFQDLKNAFHVCKLDKKKYLPFEKYFMKNFYPETQVSLGGKLNKTEQKGSLSSIVLITMWGRLLLLEVA